MKPRIALILPLVLVLFTACPAPEEPEVAVCLEGGPFLEEGPLQVEGTGDSDAHEVADLRFESYEGCERFVVDFATQGGDAAAQIGEVEAEVLRDLGVVRLSFGDVEEVGPDASEASFDGDLLRAAYSVRSPEGRSVFVDVHLADAAQAYAFTLESPARAVLDLIPGGEPIPEPAATNDLVVVLEPRPGPQAYPLEVSGYARHFEANVVLRIEQDGEEVDETFTTATGWVGAWGHYSTTIEEGPAGDMELHVGDYSAKDGTWEGTVVRLQMQDQTGAEPRFPSLS